MTTKTLDKFDNMDIIEKRIHYFLGARLRNKSLMQDALKTQESIRSRHSRDLKWDSVAEIRKWRDLR